jgi:hypothetical protein
LTLTLSLTRHQNYVYPLNLNCNFNFVFVFFLSCNKFCYLWSILIRNKPFLFLVRIIPFSHRLFPPLITLVSSDQLGASIILNWFLFPRTDGLLNQPLTLLGVFALLANIFLILSLIRLALVVASSQRKLITNLIFFCHVV